MYVSKKYISCCILPDKIYNPHIVFPTLQPMNQKQIQQEYTKDIWGLSIPVLALDVVIFTIYKGNLCVVTIETTPGVTKDHLLRLPGGILRSGE